MTQATHTAAEAPPAPAAEDRLYRRITWRLIPFLMFCYVAAYLDRVNVCFAKLQMLNELRFSETVYGLGAGIFFIGCFLFEVPSNLVLRKVGTQVWIARNMVTWGLISACFAWVSTPAQYYVLRFLLGAAEAGFYPGVIFYLMYWYPGARRPAIADHCALHGGDPRRRHTGRPRVRLWIMSAFDGDHGNNVGLRFIGQRDLHMKVDRSWHAVQKRVLYTSTYFQVCTDGAASDCLVESLSRPPKEMNDRAPDACHPHPADPGA